MSYEGLEPVALSMSQGIGPQSSEGSNSGLGETSRGGACFSSDEETSPYDGILNLQAPDLATVLEMVHGKGCWSEVAERFQDHPDFAALLNFMNSLGPEPVVFDDDDYDFLDFATLAKFLENLSQEIDEGDAPYDVVKVLLNADAVSE
ncbi:unnamed protein product [Alopecurus aequalis]